MGSPGGDLSGGEDYGARQDDSDNADAGRRKRPGYSPDPEYVESDRKQDPEYREGSEREDRGGDYFEASDSDSASSSSSGSFFTLYFFLGV